MREKLLFLGKSELTILLTNITDNSLTNDIIKESFEKIKDYKISSKISKIISLKLSSDKELNWNLDIKESITVEKYEIDNIEDMELGIKKIDSIIDPLFEKREYIQVIVDSNIFGFYILNSMKKFNAKEVFILNNRKLAEYQTCICED